MLAADHDARPQPGLGAVPLALLLALSKKDLAPYGESVLRRHRGGNAAAREERTAQTVVWYLRARGALRAEDSKRARMPAFHAPSRLSGTPFCRGA